MLALKMHTLKPKTNFNFWIRSNKPRYGEVFDDMKTYRANVGAMRPLLGLTFLQATYARRILSCSGNMYRNITTVLRILLIRLAVPLVGTRLRPCGIVTIPNCSTV